MVGLTWCRLVAVMGWWGCWVDLHGGGVGVGIVVVGLAWWLGGGVAGLTCMVVGLG